MYRVKKQIHWEKAIEQGLTGKNVTIAVLDTGIALHPDFDNRIIAFKDFIHHQNRIYDDAAHGTHVCGIIAGSGLLSNGKYCGMAPGANLVVGKILDENGNGSIQNMIDGVNWVLENKERYHIRILNISIGTDQEDESIISSIIKCVEKAWSAGIVVITAAGNKGPEPMSISPIGASNMVITVGCHDGGYFGNKENLCENYSGRGPTKYAVKKPDIVAPGTEIISCNGEFKKIRGQYFNAYSAKSGTSMATPIVTGACALYFEKYPAISNEDMKRHIIFSAKDMKEKWSKQGWGMLDIEKLLM